MRITGAVTDRGAGVVLRYGTVEESRPNDQSWRQLLESPPPGSHYVQIYDSDESLAAGVAHFAGEGFRRGEVVVLTGTPDHIKGVRRALAAQDMDPEAAVRRGQLVLTDALDCLRAVTRNGVPDRALYESVAGAILGKAKSDERYSGVRWWGEVSNVYYRQGNLPGALLDEEIGDAIVKKHGVALLCSLQCNKSDPKDYADLHALCGAHEAVIPMEDYALHRRAVDRAVAEVIGELDGPLRDSLNKWRGLPCDVHTSQAALQRLREALPERLAEILERAKQHHPAVSPPP
ncbi:MAG TPA: MEDS domain-containing protein [Burkholderiales bacterium]